MSRRAAEREIELGKVKVNGETATLGTRITVGVDTVSYLGKEIVPPKFKKNIYVMLNKPRGYLTTMSDDRGRKTVADLVSDIDDRIYPIGRLDMDSDGLLLLTNDGELALKLTHPRHEIPKTYHVKIKGIVSRETLKALNEPMTIDSYELMPVKTELISIKSEHSVLKMTLYEGKNRQIRKMCESVGLDIVRLTRISIGNIQLGDLSPGRWKHLTASQVEYLKGSDKTQKKNDSDKKRRS